jgi:hypothetical protein
VGWADFGALLLPANVGMKRVVPCARVIGSGTVCLRRAGVDGRVLLMDAYLGGLDASGSRRREGDYCHVVHRAR